jgi:ATP-binding cassette subfamily G (WHITE) protein 1
MCNLQFIWVLSQPYQYSYSQVCTFHVLFSFLKFTDFLLLISGFFVSLDNIPVYMQWLSYVAYVRYGFEGVMLTIYGFDRPALHCSVPYCHFKYPEKFLEELSLEKGVFWIDVVSLLIFFVGLRVIGYFVLRYKVRSER